MVFGAAALVALLLYLPTLRYGFVWDDHLLILNDPLLDRTNPVELFTKAFWTNPEAASGGDDMSYYRPLANLSLYVDRKVWGLDPSGYHLTNVVTHAAVVFLASLLLWEMFGSVWLAGLGGLVVGIHPAMNCIVTFISNRTYLLALFFVLAGSYALLRGRRQRSNLWPVLFAGALLLCTLALEASLVLAAIAFGWLIFNRARYRKLAAWFAAAALPVALYFLLRLGIAHVPVTASGSVLHWAATEPLRVINAFGEQLQLLVFPFNQKVIYVPSDPFTGLSGYTVLGLLFLGLPLYAVIRLRRAPAGHQNAAGASSSLRPRLSAPTEAAAAGLGWFGYGWMVLFLLPFAHLLFLGPAGRMLYLAAPGALILLAALFRPARRKRRTIRIVYGAVFLYTALLAVQTFRRNPIWRNDLSLSEAMVREAPASSTGHASYGLALMNAGREAEAIEQFRIVVQMDPNSPQPRFGLAYALIGRGDLPGAIEQFRQILKLYPESQQARNDLAVALARNGQLDSAIVEYKEVLRLDPNSEVTLNNLAAAYVQAGEPARAIPYLKAVLRLHPNSADTRANLAAAYRAAGMPDSAQLVGGTR